MSDRTWSMLLLFGCSNSQYKYFIKCGYGSETKMGASTLGIFTLSVKSGINKGNLI
jgi:hypothetical protein